MNRKHSCIYFIYYKVSICLESQIVQEHFQCFWMTKSEDPELRSWIVYYQADQNY